MINKNLNGGFNTSAIVISRKKHKLYSVFTFITPNLGIIRASLPHKRLQTLRNSSFLRPFSGMYITVVPDGEYVKVTQIDGSYVVETLDSNLENIAYTAVASELIQELFALYDVDRSVFDVVANYSKQIRNRNVRLATIILGWQLLAKSGVVPQGHVLSSLEEGSPFWQELFFASHRYPTKEMMSSLVHVLNYAWKSEEHLVITKSTWSELEQSLLVFATREVGKELQSVKFLLTL